jgi:hypothetical protein
MRRAAARLCQLCKALHTTPTDFAANLQLPTERWVQEPTQKPSQKLLAYVLDTVPHLSPSWLLLGEGEMFKQATVSSNNIVGFNYGLSVQIIHLPPASSATITHLQAQLGDKERTIQILLSQLPKHP